MRQLHAATIPDNHDFYHLNRLLEVLDRALDIPVAIISKARTLRDQLLASADKTVLLHGDLHHENILSNGGDWLVIDPKGYVGDPVFDTAAFICNPIPELLEQASPMNIIEDRIHFIAQNMGYSAQRVYDWFYVKSTLGWAWCLDDNLDPAYFYNLLHMLHDYDINRSPD